MSREAKGRPWDAQGAPREGQGDVRGGQSEPKGGQGEPKGRPCQARPGPGPKRVSPHNRKYASRHSRGGVFVGSDQARGGLSRRDREGGEDFTRLLRMGPPWKLPLSQMSYA